MKVRFTYDVFRVERFGGVARYVVELHRGLLARGVDSAVLGLLHQNGHLRGVPAVAGLDYGGWRPGIAWHAVSKVADPLVAAVAERAGGPDVLHLSYFRAHPPRRRRVAATVYDMIHERFPETAGPRDHSVAMKRATCRAADVIFAISETTREALIEREPSLADRVVVTPLGVRSVEPAPDASVPMSPYVLYVGSRRHPYKNFDGLVRAVAASPAARQALLVLFGGGPLTAGEAALLGAAGLTDRVRLAGGDDAVLAAMYAGAALYVCPSRYEGFGLPVLEAMAHGCPVVASTGGALPEVAGDAAVLVDATDAEYMAAAIERVLTDTDLRDGLRSRGFERAAAFTWEALVDRTLETYTERLG